MSSARPAGTSANPASCDTCGNTGYCPECDGNGRKPGNLKCQRCGDRGYCPDCPRRPGKPETFGFAPESDSPVILTVKGDGSSIVEAAVPPSVNLVPGNEIDWGQPAGDFTGTITGAINGTIGLSNTIPTLIDASMNANDIHAAVTDMRKELIAQRIERIAERTVNGQLLACDIGPLLMELARQIRRGETL